MAAASLVRVAAIAIAVTFGLSGQVKNEDCAACHDAAARTGKREPGTPPGYNAAALKASPHAALDCTACHSDISEVPHPEKLKKVDCTLCHSDQAAQFANSVHGKRVAMNDPLAPNCKLCHMGAPHEILPPSNMKSRVATVNVPALCGSCHREDSDVSKTRAIPQTNILENYKDSIHGVGLFQKGLTVTAVCTSCHTSHNVLPHTDPNSSIAKQNVVKTCTQCHARIEAVHRQVINGELWEKQPHLIPVCVDCHEPHKVRKVFYSDGMSNGDCMRCHGDPAIKAATAQWPAGALYVDAAAMGDSRHARIACVQCHTGGTPSNVRACATIKAKVDCSVCHEKVVGEYKESTHGTLYAQGSPDAPGCVDCHSPHATKGKTDSTSPTFSRNVPALCASCHQTGHKAAMRYTGKQTNIVDNYRESIHGKGLLQAGLTVTANCADCHTPHHELPSKDPRSSVNRANVAETCAQCHRGIYELFTASVHSTKVTKTGQPLPVCSDCHSAHSIERTDVSDFRLGIMRECGTCHQKITESYFETFHGKASQLGGLQTAKCYDCHGAHDILPVADPRSHLSRANIVATCGKCHTGSHRQFAGYLTHATHHDPKKYPFLFLTFWGMTTLLVCTLVISGAHTALWLPRSLEYARQLNREHPEGGPYVRRFRRFHRNLHLLVVSSFLGLALTGMILKFSYAPWAKVIARLLGGFEAAGVIHRFCAMLTFTYFALHIYDVIKQKRAAGKSWFQFIAGPESMLFNGRDLKEFLGSMKWFLGRGPRPEYGRWTYWEKFDYFAVFWGVAVIGGSGLLLWFPEFFTRFLPGWAVNVATTIHSDEALLAVSFIFVVHFFNTHFRPEKFPMDPVIFTEGMPLEEFKRDRPREYAQLVENGELEQMLMPAPANRDVRFWRRLGFTALTIGLILIGLIVYAVIFAYR